MDQMCIAALIGLPAVGKTTFSKLFLEIEKLPFNVLHICYDSFLNATTMNSDVPYRHQREQLLKALACAIESLKSTREFGNGIINMETCSYKDFGHNRLLILCDDNNYYLSMRYKLYQMARKFQLSYGQIFFNCNVQEALWRNNLRAETIRVPFDVFQKMSQNMETPEVAIHHWETNTYILTIDKIHKHNIIEEIIPYINQLFECPVKPLESNIVPHTLSIQSRVHEFDLLMRKRIGIIVNSLPSENKRLMAVHLNDKRKEVIKKLKNTENMDDCDHLYQLFVESLEGVVENSV